jgi:hypothetical protein
MEPHQIWDELDNYRNQLGDENIHVSVQGMTDMLAELHEADPATIRPHVITWIEHNGWNVQLHS